MARVRLSVDIDRDLKHQLAVLAALQGVSMREIVIRALRGVLAEVDAEEMVQPGAGLAGILHRYADATKREKEESAWAERAADDLH